MKTFEVFVENVVEENEVVEQQKVVVEATDYKSAMEQVEYDYPYLEATWAEEVDN